MHKTNHVHHDFSTNKTQHVYRDCNGIQWIPLATGKYNRVFKKIDGTLVMKIQKDQNNEADLPERSVRLWNLINPDLMPKARVEYDHNGLAVSWVCPFIEGIQAPDDEMAVAIIDVFNRSGRIIVDATSKNNFLKTPTGDIVCIDVGMALEFKPRLTPPVLRRQISDVSVDTWNINQAGYQTFFKQTIDYGLKKSIQTVKALIFIQENRPYIRRADFLIQNHFFISQLSFGYDCQRSGKEPLLALRMLDDLLAPSTGVFHLINSEVSPMDANAESTLELAGVHKG